MRRGWHSRGYLPHYDDDETTQFVTFRLADALPAERLNSWRLELQSLTEVAAKTELQARMDRYLDSGHGDASLRHRSMAEIVEETLLHGDGEQYDLHAWVAMPNHVHVAVTPLGEYALAPIVQAWKSVSARRMNHVMGRTGQVWQEDYFDRYIRDADHYEEVVAYVEWNPVHARLCELPENWPFGSARLKS